MVAELAFESIFKNAGNNVLDYHSQFIFKHAKELDII
jgi:hypothetical protein